MKYKSPKQIDAEQKERIKDLERVLREILESTPAENWGGEHDEAQELLTNQN